MWKDEVGTRFQNHYSLDKSFCRSHSLSKDIIYLDSEIMIAYLTNEEIFHITKQLILWKHHIQMVFKQLFMKIPEHSG